MWRVERRVALSEWLDRERPEGWVAERVGRWLDELREVDDPADGALQDPSEPDHYLKPVPGLPVTVEFLVVEYERWIIVRKITGN